METKIYFLLHSLGIGAKYRGFRYLAYGIALCMEDEDYLLRVSKTLYPKIAQTFQVSSSCVERDIRTAISVCWTRGNRDLLFSLSVHPVLTKPTNSEFFDILSSYTINEQISNFAQTYPTNLKASSNEALLFMRRYRFANCSCFSCCFKDAYPSSNVQ